jgi:phycocyanobilin:ferredoxin oxidoreductase
MALQLIDLTLRMEDALLEALDMHPVSLPPDLALAMGLWKDEPVTIETRAYAGDPIRYARVATVIGNDLHIGNVLALPDPAYPLPILGADLVAVHAGRGMIAVDLSPTLPSGPQREAQLRPLAARMAGRPPLPPGGELPAWCMRWFSPYALYTRGSLSEISDAQAVVLGFVHELGRLARSTPASPDSAGATSLAISGYLQDHRTDDRGLNLLAAMFGRSWMDRYLKEVLFPEGPALPR